MNIDAGTTPLVLLCPAWKRWGTATTVKPGAVILHSRADDGSTVACRSVSFVNGRHCRLDRPRHRRQRLRVRQPVIGAHDDQGRFVQAAVP